MSQSFIDLVRRGDTAKVAEWVRDDPEIALSRDAQGVSALMWAVYSQQSKLRDFLISGIPDMDIVEAASVGNTARLTGLLDADPSALDAISPDGWPLLHLAAAFGGPASVQLLLVRGADVHRRSGNALRNQALHAAVGLSKEPETVRLLLNAGADPNEPQHGGFRPLHQAAAAGSAAIVQLLLGAGADRKALAGNGMQAADYARERGFPELAQLLQPAEDLEPTPAPAS